MKRTKSLILSSTIATVTVTAMALTAMLAGCSRRDPAQTSKASQSPPQTITLTAALLSPTDVKLTWSDPTPNAAGYIVEFATDPKGEFTTLGFLPPDQHEFTHPRLMPETTWYYRVRSYYGPASNEAPVALPDRLSDKDYAARFKRPEDFSWATPRTVPEAGNVARASLRGPEPAKAAPADLKVVLIPKTVSGFLLTWSDRSTDEEGYLVEMKSDHDAAFGVRAVVGSGTNSFGYAFEPPERRGTLRVRAFYYGPASNIAQARTEQAHPGTGE
jgi:hypothetical protein